jgi:hypothetical protein
MHVDTIHHTNLQIESKQLNYNNKLINTIIFIKVIISRAQHYPHTYDFAGPTANKKKLPLMTRLAEEGQL